MFGNTLLLRRLIDKHAQTKRNFHPLAILGLLLFKKIALVSALRTYGSPRVYRRMLEQNKLITPVEHRKNVAIAIRTAFDSPTQIFFVIQSNEYIQRILSHLSSAKVPAVIVESAQTILNVLRSKK